MISYCPQLGTHQYSHGYSTRRKPPLASESTRRPYYYFAARSNPIPILIRPSPNRQADLPAAARTGLATARSSPVASIRPC